MSRSEKVAPERVQEMDGAMQPSGSTPVMSAVQLTGLVVKVEPPEPSESA